VPTPTCVAASPTPSAALMVAHMSRINWWSSSPNSVTGSVCLCITGVPQRVMGRTLPPWVRSASAIVLLQGSGTTVKYAAPGVAGARLPLPGEDGRYGIRPRLVGAARRLRRAPRRGARPQPAHRAGLRHGPPRPGHLRRRRARRSDALDAAGLVG